MWGGNLKIDGRPGVHEGLLLPRIPMHTCSQDPGEEKDLLLFIWLAAHSPYWA